MTVSSGITVDDLDLPTETIGHVSSVVRLEGDNPVIVYAPKDGDGKAELVRRGDKYRVTFEHYPWNPDAVDMYEVEWFDTLGSAVRQLAEWMSVDVEQFFSNSGACASVTGSFSEDDLALPQETREHILLCEVDEWDHTVIVYQQKPDLGRGEVTLTTYNGKYRVSHTYDPFAGEREEGRELFDDLYSAVCQMAVWLDVDVEELLSTGGESDG
jgi:hypothetical protein